MNIYIHIHFPYEHFIFLEIDPQNFHLTFELSFMKIGLTIVSIQILQ